MADYPNQKFIVTPEWLAAHVDDPDVRIIDTRGTPQYGAGHIKNAVNFPVARLDDPAKPGQGALIPAERFATVFGNLGIGSDDLVVLYDQGLSNMSARTFWAFDVYGHERVAILNGGISAWATAGNPITSDLPQPEPKQYTPHPHPERSTDKAHVQESLGKPDVVLLDVRSDGEYTGAENHAMRGGHIPGAKHLEWANALQPSQVPLFRAPEEIAQQLAGAGVSPDKEVITYCQSGMRASHSYYVLRLMGYDKVSNYSGSWGDWGNDPSMPIEQGNG